MIRVNQVRLNINENENLLKKKIAKKLRISSNCIVDFKIFKKSLDARRKNNINYVYSIDVVVNNEEKVLKKNKNVKKSPNYKYLYPKVSSKIMSPVIIGFGPAGMFSALLLAELGFKPIVYEQGEPVDKRTKSVNEFWKSGKLNEFSNVQFGEGGAGTFSDGKLTTRIKDKRCRKVLEYLIESGAPKEIIYEKNPHIGTDVLKPVVKNIRKKIIELGGQIHFNSFVSDFEISEDKIQKIKVNDEWVKVENVILALGHSSRKTFEKLKQHKVTMEAKPFAVGLRIEHPQRLVDKSQYGDPSLSSKLGAAEYKFTYKTSENRSVYSFCMCPGGFVVASSSEKNSVVTNGMSRYSRNNKNSNSALLVNVTPDDFPGEDVLRGMYFQRQLERKAFQAAGKNYFAPAQTVGSLFNKSNNQIGSVRPTYNPGLTCVNFNDILPKFVINSIKEGIEYMGSKLKGFDMDDAILTGIETRSSSPVRISRNSDSLESINIQGLYPCGEGAGYAGGIMSSAVDGIKVAEKIAEK